MNVDWLQVTPIKPISRIFLQQQIKEITGRKTLLWVNPTLTQTTRCKKVKNHKFLAKDYPNKFIDYQNVVLFEGVQSVMNHISSLNKSDSEKFFISRV